MKPTYKESITSFFRNYVNFSGKSTRTEFLHVFFTLLVVSSVLSILMGPTHAEPTTVALIAAIVAIIFGLGTLLPYIALMVRRLRDQNKSPWLILTGLIPFIGGLILFILLLGKSAEPVTT